MINKRLISKMLNIKKQKKNSLDLQIDMEGLHKGYISINNMCDTLQYQEYNFFVYLSFSIG